MTNKIALKEKQRIKKEQKALRESIINNYISEIKEIIDEGYVEMMSHLDEFNKELMNLTIEYSNLENIITKVFKENMSCESLEDINERIIAIEKKNEEIYSIATSRDISSNRLLRHLPIVATQVSDVIKRANEELKANKNRVYLVSMITNRSFDVFKHYNSVIIDIALESNEYIDTYIDARENFIDFVEKCKKSIDEITMQKEIEHIEQTVKYKQRLRVTYTELEKFLKYKGFECNRQGNTTHAVWKNPTTGKSVPVPNKSGTMCQGTTSKVLKQIGSNRQELADFLYA